MKLGGEAYAGDGREKDWADQSTPPFVCPCGGRKFFFPAGRLSQYSNICSRNFTDGAGCLRYLSKERHKARRIRLPGAPSRTLK